MAYYVLSYCVSFIFSGYGNTGLAHLAHWCGVRVSHPFDDDPVHNTIGYWILYLMMNAECQCIGNPDEGILPVLKTAEEIKPPNFCMLLEGWLISGKKQEHTQTFKNGGYQHVLEEYSYIWCVLEGIIDMHNKGFNLSLNLSIPLLLIYLA